MKQAFFAATLIGACACLIACGAADTSPARSAPTDNAAAPAQPTAAAQPVSAPATPEAPAAPGAKPASASPEAGDYGKYYGSCKKDSTKHCSDAYCKGPNCDQLMGGRKKCDGVASQDKCPGDSATAICLMPTDIAGNIVNAVNFYYDGENHEPSCNAFGAKMLKK